MVEIDGTIAVERLKDHYKHCIRLSASNKINPKNAFDLKLIDYMQDLVSTAEDGQMNFKIASSALDVGAKIYSNRVDCIQSEAQKVASSILMALDGQGDKQQQQQQQEEDDDDDDHSDTTQTNEDEGQGKAAKKKPTNRNKNVKTVVEDENVLDARIEKMVLGDPFLDGLSQDYDMSCPAALICYNALTRPDCLLTIESNNSRKDFKEISSTQEPSTTNKNNSFVTLITKNVNCAQIMRNNLTNQILSKLANFLFNEKTTSISGTNPEIDVGFSLNRKNSKFNPEQYDNVSATCFDDAESFTGGDDEPNEIPNLDRIAASKPTDYGYSHEHSRLLNTWAGPHAWKAVKAKKNTVAPNTTRKRAKLEQKLISFEGDFSTSIEEIVDKHIRHSHNVIRSWKKGFIPEDHSLNGDKIIDQTIKLIYNKPEETYECAKAPTAEAMALVAGDSSKSMSCPASPAVGGFDDVCDSDDEFRADPVEGNAPLNTTVIQQADLEFAGEHLIEQPYTVAQVNIPFAKIAKKMDVRKLKRVMWDLLHPSEEEEEQQQQATPSPAPTDSTVHREFSHLYGELPVKVSSKMASDLSQPIAFVTLLHLANEKNLRLIPQQDCKDFIIELV